MEYNITRKKASKMLNLSTRSVDRYIKSGKLRTKKDWKIIMINKWDIDKLMSNSKDIKQEVIIPNKNERKNKETESQEKEKKEHSSVEEKEKIVTTSKTTTIMENNQWLELVYTDLKNTINEKDQLIQNLSMKLWRAEEIAHNSISLIEFKKSQFLLEESRGYLNKEVEDLNKYKKVLKRKLKYEKRTNYILLTFMIILFLTMVVVWFSKI